MSNFVKLGYSGTIIKTNDSCFCIQKKVAELFRIDQICIGFDKKQLEISFFEAEELKQYSEKKKKQKEEKPSKLLNNQLFLKPFKILMLDKAQKFLKVKNICFFNGRINKLKNFKLEGVENNANLEGVKNSKENLDEILNGRTVWILATRSIEKRTISSTNPEYKNILTNEDDKRKCETYVSIMKNELANLESMDYFKESLELES